MRWRIQTGPEQLGDNLWEFTIVSGHHSRQIRAHVGLEVAELRADTQESLAVDLVKSHLNDHVPPDEVSLSPGWDFEQQKAVAGEMGFTHVRGLRMRWADLARRLNLPHWLQPRP